MTTSVIFLPPSQMAVLPGIDPNDLGKSMATFQFITTFATLIPLADSSAAHAHHADLTEFYRRVDRSKLKSVAAILDKYRGQEQKLYRKLKKKYGVSPEELRRRQAQD